MRSNSRGGDEGSPQLMICWYWLCIQCMRLRDHPTKLWLSCSKHFLCSLGWHIHWRLVQICNPVAFWHFASRSALQSGGNLCSMLQISQAGTWSGTFPCFLLQSTRQPKQILSENFAVGVLLERSYARLTKQDICLHHLPPTTRRHLECLGREQC